MQKSFMDRIFRNVCLVNAFVVPVVLVWILLRLVVNSSEAWETFGIQFLFSSEWEPVHHRFGALPALTGTILTTAVAVAIAVPLGFTTAFLLSSLPEGIRRTLSMGFDLLAAIPSVIYGMWGLFVLVPIMQNHVHPLLAGLLRSVHLISSDNTGNGFGFLTAGLVLALMILPFMSASMRDVFAMTPPLMKEAAYGIGCTRWETAKDIVLRHGFRGILGGIMIGIGRALGETMAVLFVIGNVCKIPNSLFDGGTTIAATLANNFSEADGLMKSALFALALILLASSCVIQMVAHRLLSREAKI